MRKFYISVLDIVRWADVITATRVCDIAPAREKS
jgi:hypothetical protein